MKLYTSKWQSFELGKLFVIQCSKYHNPKNYKDGNIPYVARTAFNNGVVKKIATDEMLYPANCIIIGAESAMAFYQTKEFLTGNKIYRLYLNDSYAYELNPNLALFFCALINNLGKKYTYTNAFVSNKIEKEKILLPIISKDKPDWEFMENYIRKSKKDIEKLLTIYRALDSNGGGVKSLLILLLALLLAKRNEILYKGLLWK